MEEHREVKREMVEVAKGTMLLKSAVLKSKLVCLPGSE